MPQTANPTILVVGKSPRAVQPPIRQRNILAKFRRFDCPFSLRNEKKVSKLLYHNWGEGYYQVYSPAHAQRMKIYFKGRVETNRWGKIIYEVDR